MRLTNDLALPYPEDDDSVSPHRDLRALAEAAERMLTLGLPTGAIVPFSGGVIPAGWHLCDGSAHGSAALQTVTGSANTPDLRGRFLAGQGNLYAHGATGGSDTATVTTAQLGPHDHNGGTTAGQQQDHTHTGQPPDVRASDVNHDHVHPKGASGGGQASGQWMGGPDGGGIQAGAAPSYGGISAWVNTTDPGGNHAHGLPPFAVSVAAAGDAHGHAAVGSAAAGGGAARPNVPLNVSLNYIIKG